jgi:hypothetical protein
MKAVLPVLALALVPFLSQEKDSEQKLPTVGQPAPVFRLNDHTGKAVEIGGEADAWRVVAFFPKAATPG